HEAAETLEALRGLGEAQEALEAMEQGARAFDEPVREGAQ
ncbi:MAG: hydrogenase formation protein HypC, partial [Rhodobacteraceae bacterium]|nr:hydrogenase formation protein HypC [Paracoccaceae bacterium]